MVLLNFINHVKHRRRTSAGAMSGILGIRPHCSVEEAAVPRAVHRPPDARTLVLVVISSLPRCIASRTSGHAMPQSGSQITGLRGRMRRAVTIAGIHAHVSTSWTACAGHMDMKPSRNRTSTPALRRCIARVSCCDLLIRVNASFESRTGR